MVAWIEARIWQIGAIGGGLVALTLAVSLGVALFQKANLERDKAELETQVATLTSNLSQCRRNTASLKDAIDNQNTRIVELESAGRRVAAETANRVAAAERENRDLERRIARLQAVPAQGDDVCERVFETHRQIQEAFR